MSDVHAPYDEEDRLPWLEAVDEDEEPAGPSFGKLLGAVILGLVVLGAAVGGYFWLADRGAEGRGELIAAPEGDYKVKPDDPGGMEVEGEGDVTFAASEGADPKGRLDVGAVPEAPVQARPATPSEPAGARQPSAEGTTPLQDVEADQRAMPATAAEGGAGGGTIQLGAFSTPAGATAAWRALSERFGYLEPLGHVILPVRSGDRTLYRLRASGPGAANICGRLRVAGETCVSVN